MGRELVRLHRDRGSLVGRVIYRGESGDEEEGQERPWREVLVEAGAVVGAGKLVMVRVFGTSRDTTYNSGYGQLTEYLVELPRAGAGS